MVHEEDVAAREQRPATPAEDVHWVLETMDSQGVLIPLHSRKQAPPHWCMCSVISWPRRAHSEMMKLTGGCDCQRLGWDLTQALPSDCVSACSWVHQQSRVVLLALNAAGRQAGRQVIPEPIDGDH